MYEIWLMANIVWEMALGVWPLVAAAALLWVGLLVLAWRRRAAAAGPAWTPALVAGALIAAVAFVAVPALTRSSLSELSYWVDWLSLAAIAAAAGAAAFAFAWPLVRLWHSFRSPHPTSVSQGA
jgi:hypothetical protein